MKSLGRIFWLLGVSAVCGMPAQDSSAQAISTSSPFLPQNGAAAGAGAENSPVELRGIMAAPGGPLFGLYDPVKKQGGWVKVNEAGRDFTVRSYDAANNVVTVEYQGRVLSVALKAAKIETMPAQVGPPRPLAGPQAVNAPTVDEAKRLEAVAAEVQRRRQMRQAAAAAALQRAAHSNGPAQPQPPSNGFGGNR